MDTRELGRKIHGAETIAEETELIALTKDIVTDLINSNKRTPHTIWREIYFLTLIANGQETAPRERMSSYIYEAVNESNLHPMLKNSFNAIVEY